MALNNRLWGAERIREESGGLGWHHADSTEGTIGGTICRSGIRRTSTPLATMPLFFVETDDKPQGILELIVTTLGCLKCLFDALGAKWVVFVER
jgi:hypothetical protein